jgi:hypothetical protein
MTEGYPQEPHEVEEIITYIDDLREYGYEIKTPDEVIEGAVRALLAMRETTDSLPPVNFSEGLRGDPMVDVRSLYDRMWVISSGLISEEQAGISQGYVRFLADYVDATFQLRCPYEPHIPLTPPAEPQ